MTLSGMPIVHSSFANERGSGRSLGSPSGLPASIQAAMDCFSAVPSERSFAQGLGNAAPSFPCMGAANHGGIVPASVTDRIIVARRATAS